MEPDEVKRFEQGEFAGLADWSDYTGKAVCPVCERPGRLQVRQQIQLKPFGTFSLAGVQLKSTGQVVWVFRCLACGAYGPAEPH